jgi:hypothetical protein
MESPETRHKRASLGVFCRRLSPRALAPRPKLQPKGSFPMPRRRTATDAETPLVRYRRVVEEVLEARGRFCECCKTPARRIHHIIPCSIDGIASALFFDPVNMMIVCNDCHALFHPLVRRRSWKDASRLAAMPRQHARGRSGPKRV